MPKNFGIPDKKAVFFLIKGLLFLSGTPNFFGPSYFDLALTVKEIVKKISKLQETGGYSSLTSKIKGVCKLYAPSTIGPKEHVYNFKFLKFHRIFFKL